MNQEKKRSFGNAVELLFKGLKQEPAILAVLAIMLAGTVIYGKTFLNYGTNIINVLHTASMMGIMGLGVNLCFLIGARDLTVGAIGALVSMVSAWFSMYGLVPAVIAGLIAGALIGLANGLIIAKFKIQPFIATLAMQLVARGIAILLNNGNSFAANLELKSLQYIGDANVFGIIPFPTLIFIILVVILGIVCKYTTFGRSIYAVGGNEESALMMGVNVDKIKILVFTISGITAAVSGIILCGRLRAGQPSACTGWEMTIMAAVVIGGTRVRGGMGRVSGIFFGTIFVQFITNLINLHGHISAYWKNVITGAVLLIAVLIQTITDTQREAANLKKHIPNAQLSGVQELE